MNSASASTGTVGLVVSFVLLLRGLRRLRLPNAPALVFAGIFAPSSLVLAQPDVRVQAGNVTDSRYVGGDRMGGLSVKVKVRGDGMDGVKALRFLLTDARDDLGNQLVPEAKESPKFTDVRGDATTEQLWLKSPSREASTFSVSGRVELFIPGRDPNAVVKVAKALGSPGRPLSSPGLKAADLRLTLLSRVRRSPEIVTFSGRTTDFDRIRSIRILRPDGREIGVGSTGRLSNGEEAVMTLQAREPIPGNASLVFTILTAKARVLVPFRLAEVPLP